ncbi:MAG TPA: DUF2877 domain-containing protein [Anaerolineales bacterium]
MYLRAISIGYAVPSESFDATVHSVFQSSINLRLNKVNRLLTLTTSSEDDLPQGIRLDAPEGFTFEKFQIGEQAVCRDGILHLENTSLTIQLHGARRWKCDLPALEFDTTKPIVSAAWSLVWEALNKRQRLLESEIVAEEIFHSNESVRAGVSHKAGRAMRDLVDATRRDELTDTTAISALIGLGSGLTPSGDDLLVGYMAGLWSTVREKSERAQFILSLGKRIIRLSQKTNDISRTYLYHAVRGQVSSRLANLAEAICRGEDPEHLLDIAETAMKVGHTSGMDAVTGMLAGLIA